MGKNPLEVSTLIGRLDFVAERFWSAVAYAYRMMGMPEVDLVTIGSCFDGTLGWMVAGNFDCGCPPQMVRMSCHLPWCPRCADKERKRIASDMVSFIRKLYLTAELSLEVSLFEFTLPREFWEVVGNGNLNLLRERAVNAVYEWLGYDPKKFMLFVDANCDIWGSEHITRGIQPHVHVTMYSLVYDKKARRFFESPKIGTRVPKRDLDRLRSLWRDNFVNAFHLRLSSEVVNVKYHWIDERLYGENIAYAKLSARLQYCYRSSVVDYVKYVRQAVVSKEYPIDFNYEWTGRLLNFYGGKSRGDKRFKHIQRFGCLADRVQRKYANMLAHQFKRDCSHDSHKDCKDCPNENFKSPSQRSSDSRKPRCLRHRMSVGEWLTGRGGLPFVECVTLFPIVTIVGKVKERRRELLFMRSVDI